MLAEVSRSSRWCAACAGATMAVLTAVLGGAYQPGERVAVAVGLALVLGGAAAGGALRWRRWDAWLLALIAWGALVVAACPRDPLAGKQILASWLVAWGLTAAARSASGRGREVAIGVLVAGATLVAVAVGLELLGLGRPRVGGMFANPNLAAALLAPTAVAAAVGADGRARWRTAPVGAALALAVAFTGSRACLLGVVAALVAVLPRRRHRLIALGVGSAAVVAVVAWRLVAYPDPLAWHRIAIWRGVIALVVEHPLTGVGPGALAEAAGGVRIAHPASLGVYQRLIASAESTPLGLLVATGLVGAGLALAWVWSWARSGAAAALLAAPRGRGVVVAMAVTALFHDQLEVEAVLWWWTLLLALVSPPGGEPAPAADAGPGRWLRGLALTWIVLWGLAQPAAAGWLWSRRGPSAAAAERALAVEPWLVGPARWCTGELLRRPRWTWREAAEAVGWAERGVASSPGRASLWADFARVHVRALNELGWSAASAESARGGLARATELEPRLPWYWLERAELERDLGELEAARALVRRAVELEPAFVRGHLLLARLELDLGRVEAARESMAAAEAARRSARGRHLTAYERELALEPSWQVESVVGGLR